LLANREHVAPPASMMARPGPMVDGPGPGVLGMPSQPQGMMGGPMGMMGPGMGMHGMHGMMGPGMGMPPMPSQVQFIGPSDMTVGWQAGGAFAPNQLISGDYYDFHQGAVYQLMFDGVSLPGKPTRSLYPTLEVRSAHPTTTDYLQHNAIPVEITEEDLEHVFSSNMVTKVIYLPDPEFQARAIAGVETLVSTKLDPGVDPVQQAEQMGTIMLILRFGNKDLQPSQSVMNADGSVSQVSYQTLDGNAGQTAAPTPISYLQGGVGGGVPGTIIAAGGGLPGQPSMPVAGLGPMPPWGMPMTGTPIGLPGPAHLPLGGPAGLRSQTIRNLSPNKIPKPTRDLLIDVKHNPGYSIPKPVSHIQYTENHPVFGPGEVSVPAGGGAYCPPGGGF
ncbi:MAG: hypothetical protein ABJZ55_23575, partial [Fuerstiella sp.]